MANKFNPLVRESAPQLIGEKFENSPRKIKDLIYLSGWTKLYNVHRVGKKSKLFPPGSDFAGQTLTRELSGADSAGVQDTSANSNAA